MTAASVRYLGMTSIPMHVIAVALAGPALLTLYGSKYAGAVVVATAAPLLCLPKAFIGPIQSFFASTDEQNYFLVCTGVASFIDIGVAWWLIPAHGALGACLGSGIAQAAAVIALWVIGIRKYKIQLPWSFFARITAISTAASLVSYAIAARLGAPWSLVVGCTVAVLLFFGLGSFFKLLEPEDVSRFRGLTASLPKRFSRPLDFIFVRLSTLAASDSAAV